MSLIIPPLDEPGLPARGVTTLGLDCECDCHRMAGVYHVMACCQPRYVLQPGDEVTIGDQFTGTTATIIGVISPHAAKPVMVLTELQVDVDGKHFATLKPEPADWNRIDLHVHDSFLEDTIKDAAKLRITATRSDGSKIYPWHCGSPSKHMNCWLGFDTEDEALTHKRAMDVMLESYDEPDSKWNKEFWTKKPAPWVVFNNIKLLVRES